MNYLIFRTDRIGDFLITSSLINAIKRNDEEAKIYIVASNKNESFVKRYDFVEKVFSLNSNKLIDKINLFFKLRKYKFDNIIISDKKNRSIILGIILKSKKKIFNVSKKTQKNILKIFYKNVILDNDNLKDRTLLNILSENCETLGIDFKDEDFHYLSLDKFKNKFLNGELINLDNIKFILFHYDEKWELKNYSKVFKRATNLTDINVKEETFMKFLLDLSEHSSKIIILTTGNISTSIIEKIKNTSLKINDSLYEIRLKDRKAYLLVNESFFSISYLIAKSSLFISCHGAFTHIASNYKVKILDVIEQNKVFHYSKITKHMKNYKSLYRDNFEKLSKNIINNL